MGKNKREEIRKIKKEALRRVRTSDEPKRLFREDFLKHYIRMFFWKKRVQNLLSARNDIHTIRYFSLCGQEAYDVRLLEQEKFIDSTQREPAPVVYCECNKPSYNILNGIYRKKPYQGFSGYVEKISTDTLNKDFGNFWGQFPFDVINLDFWGDIHSGGSTNKNVYYALRSIIFQQSHLKRPYELWITERAKMDRVALSIQHEYRKLIQYNINQYPRFKKSFNRKFPSIQKVKNLDIEIVAYVGFLQWLQYVTSEAYSVVEECQILCYKRMDRNNESYKLYNFLMRIKPFEQVIMPSPVSEAAIFCSDHLKQGIGMSLTKPTDIDRKFRRLSSSTRKAIEKSLKKLQMSYERDRKGYLS